MTEGVELHKEGVELHKRDWLEEFQNGDDNVIHIAEPGRLKLLGVVQTSRPVDGDVTTTVVQFGSAF